MTRLFLFLMLSLLLTACSHTYYVVRHAEKAILEKNRSTDVPLTISGLARANALKEILQTKKVANVYSTNTIRTMATAKPTADYFKLRIQPYGPKPDSSFIDALKLLKRNTLIVGHSNTVDDIVNGLMGRIALAGDLQDGEYNNLFVIKMRGKKVWFERRTFGQ